MPIMGEQTNSEILRNGTLLCSLGTECRTGLAHVMRLGSAATATRGSRSSILIMKSAWHIWQPTRRRPIGTAFSLWWESNPHSPDDAVILSASETVFD